ncbi:MAG: hypothetical protein N2513_04165 [Deltaproteobacteria bacterium]|nr:hypothetical protein [Deltaproteobacteria bacterium]
MDNDCILYLQVGDWVYHKKNARWGMGVVIEERRSELPGGFCYVRIDFQDGKVRIFDNNFRSATCCYYSGIEKIELDKEKLVRRFREKKSQKKSLPKLKK